LDRHAEALEKPENNNFVVEYDESFIDELEPGQREFVKNFLEEEPEYNISDEVADMPKEISQLLQLLVRVDQVQRQAGEMIGEYNTEIAHKVRERSRIIPIDSDDQVLGLFEDTEEERRQSEFQNAHNILRLLSRQ
jgi:Mg/Co/Ni transporter MgtE